MITIDTDTEEIFKSSNRCCHIHIYAIPNIKQNHPNEFNTEIDVLGTEEVNYRARHNSGKATVNISEHIHPNATIRKTP